MKNKFKFDENNKNLLLVYDDKRIIYFVSCPPIKDGCDIINFTGEVNNRYHYNFDGLVLITTNYERTLYYKGNVIATTIKNI